MAPAPALAIVARFKAGVINHAPPMAESFLIIET